MKHVVVVLSLILILVPLRLKAAPLDYLVTDQESSQIDGLTYQRISADVYNDSNTKSIQNITLLKGDDTLSLTTWSYFAPNGSLVNKDVLALARDFEAKNPNYEVMAGVNGDYFQVGQTINANMIFGSRLAKSMNHDKYFAIEMSPNGKLLNTHKKIELGEYKAYLYDQNTNALLKVVTLETFNDSTIEDNQTGLFYNYDSISKASGYHFSFEIVSKSSTNNNFFFLLNNSTTKNSQVETTSEKVSLLSKDTSVNTILASGAYVKVQKVVKNVFASSTLLGVDSRIIENGTIKSFEEIGGQGVDYTKDRHPRTGIGFDASNNPILITVDGRQAGFSNGVNLREFASIMKENEILNGFNLDGGGSTEAIIKDGDDFKILNSPSEGGPLTYRAVSNAVFFIKPKEKALITTTLEEDTLTVFLPSLNYEILVNGVKRTPTKLAETFELDAMMDNSITVVTKGVNSMSVFEDVIYAYYVKKITLPTFFVEANHINPVFELKVSFEDPDKMIDRMYVIHEESNIQKVALIQYAGLRKATFDNIVEGINHFKIHYELTNGAKETIDYEFTYTQTEVEPIPEEQNGNSFNNLMIIIPSITAILILGIIGIIVIGRMKK